jgi:hypothetical protein
MPTAAQRDTETKFTDAIKVQGGTIESRRVVGGKVHLVVHVPMHAEISGAIAGKAARLTARAFGAALVLPRPVADALELPA